MFKHKSTIGAALFIGAGLLGMAASCSKTDKQQNSRSDDVVVEIPFRATVGDEDFECGRSYSVGADNTQVQPKDFRYFISDVKFVRADGSRESLKLEQDGKWQSGIVALLDYATTEANCANSSSPDSETRKVVRGVIKRGDYSGIEFALGLDDKTNHLDSATAQPPLNNPGMWWSWKGGYKEVRLELTITSDGAAKNKDYLVHHGATSCSGNSPETYKCTHENNLLVSLSGNPFESGIKFDVAKFFDGEKLQEELKQNQTTKQFDVVQPSPATTWGCMAFPLDGDCEFLFANLGLSFKDAIGGLGASQKVFSLFANSSTQGLDPNAVKTDGTTCTDEKKKSVGDSCFVRDTALNVSIEVGDSSHPTGPSGYLSHNAGLTCISCHQSKGAGKGLHTFSGTVYKSDKITPAAGAIVKVFNEKHPPTGATDTRTPVKELVTDKSGNFYTTTDYLAQLTNANKEYWITVTDSDGSGAMNMNSAKITGQCSQCHVGGQRIWINK